MDRRAWQATVYVVIRVGHDLATKSPHHPHELCERHSRLSSMLRGRQPWEGETGMCGVDFTLLSLGS